MSLCFSPIPQELSAVATKDKCIGLARIFLDTVIMSLREVTWFPLYVNTEGVSNAVINLAIKELKKVGYEVTNYEDGPSLIIQNPYLNTSVEDNSTEKQGSLHYTSWHCDFDHINCDNLESLFKTYYNNATIIVRLKRKKTLIMCADIENWVNKLNTQGYKVFYGTCGIKGYNCISITNVVYTERTISFARFAQKWRENVLINKEYVDLDTLSSGDISWIQERGYKISYAITHPVKTYCLVITNPFFGQK